MHRTSKSDWWCVSKDTIGIATLVSGFSWNVFGYIAAPAHCQLLRSRSRELQSPQELLNSYTAFVPLEMASWTRFWRWPFRFNSLPLCIDRWLIPLPTGWKLSFGVWVRFTVDPPGVPPTITSVCLIRFILRSD